jgi:hypothetical protein
LRVLVGAREEALGGVVEPIRLQAAGGADFSSSDPYLRRRNK